MSFVFCHVGPSHFSGLSNVSQSKSETGVKRPLHPVQADRSPSSASLFLQHVQTTRVSLTSPLADCMMNTHRATGPTTSEPASRLGSERPAERSPTFGLYV